MKKVLFIFFMFSILALTGCQNSQSNLTNISTTELKDILNEDYQFVDIRTPEEYQGGHIEEFNINIDFYEFSSNHALLDQLDKDKPVVLICNSGNRSTQASNILDDLGFKEIYNVTGGVMAWDGPLVV